MIANAALRKSLKPARHELPARTTSGIARAGKAVKSSTALSVSASSENAAARRKSAQLKLHPRINPRLTAQVRSALVVFCVIRQILQIVPRNADRRCTAFFQRERELLFELFIEFVVRKFEQHRIFFVGHLKLSQHRF